MLCLDRAPRHDPQRRAAARGSVPRKEGPLYCAACSFVITDDSERIEVQGAHEHTFVNPSGMVFHIGCFASAGGCVPHGPPSKFFSWFPGHAWRIVACGDCRAHLGWSFGDGPSFYGLVLDRLSDSP